MSEPKSNSWMNNIQFAKRIGVKVRTLNSYIQRGWIKPRRLPSGLPFYTEEDVETFFKGGKIEW